MSFGAIVFLAIGLAMDATAVSAARGLAVPEIRARHVVLVAGFFGSFQALMPVIGWSLGARLGPLVQAWDHWIAFVLLVFVGGKMLSEARGAGENESKESTLDPFALRSMLALSIATSIDAIEIVWPDGHRQVVTQVAADQTLVIRQETGARKPAP